MLEGHTTINTGPATTRNKRYARLKTSLLHFRWWWWWYPEHRNDKPAQVRINVINGRASACARGEILSRMRAHTRRMAEIPTCASPSALCSIVFLSSVKTINMKTEASPKKKKRYLSLYNIIADPETISRRSDTNDGLDCLA